MAAHGGVAHLVGLPCPAAQVTAALGMGDVRSGCALQPCTMLPPLQPCQTDELWVSTIKKGRHIFPSSSLLQEAKSLCLMGGGCCGQKRQLAPAFRHTQCHSTPQAQQSGWSLPHSCWSSSRARALQQHAKPLQQLCILARSPWPSS